MTAALLPASHGLAPSLVVIRTHTETAPRSARLRVCGSPLTTHASARSTAGVEDHTSGKDVAGRWLQRASEEATHGFTRASLVCAGYSSARGLRLPACEACTVRLIEYTHAASFCRTCTTRARVRGRGNTSRGSRTHLCNDAAAKVWHVALREGKRRLPRLRNNK